MTGNLLTPDHTPPVMSLCESPAHTYPFVHLWRSCFLCGLMLCIACADEPEAPAPAPPADLLMEIPPLDAGNPAEAVVIHWFQAVEKGDLEAATQWMARADTIGLALPLQKYLRPRRSTTSTLENVYCPEGADSLICLIAWTRKDLLMLDSVRLIRQGDHWKIHLFTN